MKRQSTELIHLITGDRYTSAMTCQRKYQSGGNYRSIDFRNKDFESLDLKVPQAVFDAIDVGDSVVVTLQFRGKDSS